MSTPSHHHIKGLSEFEVSQSALQLPLIASRWIIVRPEKHGIVVQYGVNSRPRCCCGWWGVVFFSPHVLSIEESAFDPPTRSSELDRKDRRHVHRSIGVKKSAPIEKVRLLSKEESLSGFGILSVILKCIQYVVDPRRHRGCALDDD